MADTTLFEEAHAGLSAVFDKLRREVDRIDNLDAKTRTKQQNVETLTAAERELSGRIAASQANLDAIETKIAEKVEEIGKLSEHLDSLKKKTREVLGL